MNKSSQIDQVQITIPVEYLTYITDLLNSVNVISKSLSKSDQINPISIFFHSDAADCGMLDATSHSSTATYPWLANIGVEQDGDWTNRCGAVLVKFVK